MTTRLKILYHSNAILILSLPPPHLKEGADGSFISKLIAKDVLDIFTSSQLCILSGLQWCSSGVPQHSFLSPTLFLLFINDILHASASDVHSFADDSTLHKSSSFQCQPSFAHNYCVELSNARINRFSDGFFPSTSRLWNSLPSSVFPASFKRQVYHHLRDQMA